MKYKSTSLYLHPNAAFLPLVLLSSLNKTAKYKYYTVYTIRFLATQNNFFSIFLLLLILSGDVETNPGPVNNCSSAIVNI